VANYFDWSVYTGPGDCHWYYLKNFLAKRDKKKVLVMPVSLRLDEVQNGSVFSSDIPNLNCHKLPTALLSTAT